LVYLVESGAEGALCCAAGIRAFGFVYIFGLARAVRSGGELVASVEGCEDAGLKPGATLLAVRLRRFEILEGLAVDVEAVVVVEVDGVGGAVWRPERAWWS
jgi:hypothetical protein